MKNVIKKDVIKEAMSAVLKRATGAVSTFREAISSVRRSAPYQNMLSRPFESARKQWREKFSQRLLVTSTMAGVFLTTLPLSFPFTTWMMMVKGGAPLMGGMATSAAVLGVIGGVGVALAATLDLVQYGLDPDKTMQYTNARDQKVEGPRRKVIQLMNLQDQISTFSTKLDWNPNNERARNTLSEIFTRADQLMDGVKVIDAGQRGASAEKYEFSLACDKALLKQPGNPAGV